MPLITGLIDALVGIGIVIGAISQAYSYNSEMNNIREEYSNYTSTKGKSIGSSICKFKIPNCKVPDLNMPQLTSTQGGIVGGTIPYQEPMLNGVPVSEVMAQQAADVQAIFAKAKENAKAKKI